MNKFVKIITPLVFIPLIAGCALLGNPIPVNTVNIKTQILGTNGQVVSTTTIVGKFHKDDNVMGMKLDLSKGTFEVQSLTSTNSPAVIAAGGVAQATDSTAFWNGLNQTMTNAAAIASKAAAAYATGGATVAIPAVTSAVK